jgi:ADP-ribosylglycohydrolase
VGVQTGRALRDLAAGGPVLRSAPPDERGLGNGALMRVLPLALVHQGTDAELARDARLSSRVTHPHPRSQLCCARYVLWARGFLRAVPDPWAWASERLRASLAADRDDAAIAELEMHIRPARMLLAPGG